MLALFRSGRSGSASANTKREVLFGRDGRISRYLTDGVHLYRFLGSVASRAGELVGVENCWSLDIMLVPVDELQRRHFRAVAID